ARVRAHRQSGFHLHHLLPGRYRAPRVVSVGRRHRRQPLRPQRVAGVSPGTGSMRTFQKAVLGIGALTLAVLLWKMDTEEVGRLVLRVGWGMVLVIAQEIVAHLLNAAAWRFAFFTDQAVAFSFLELVKLRVAGDAINY